MSNWYAGRREVKRVAGINGTDFNAPLDRIIEAQSRRIDRLMRRFFIPLTDTKLFPWPPEQSSRAYILWLPGHDLLSVTTLQTKAQDSSPTTIASGDFFLEPQDSGPPYSRIEIDLSSDAAFEAGDTTQRSISVNGSWGYSNDTRSAGTVSSGLSSSASATSFVASNGALIDVGNTLLIESEQIFVSEVENAAIGSLTVSETLNADRTQISFTVSDGSLLNADEIIQIDSEKMLIVSISSNTVTVERAYDGTTLASHTSGTAIHGFRTYTIERGVNGTTAATHADSTAISVYEPPFEINELCREESIAAFYQERSGMGREIGAGEGAREFKAAYLSGLRKETVALYKRTRMAAI